MANDRRSNKKDPMRPWKIGAAAFVILIVLLAWFNAYWSSQNNSFISITPRSIILGLLDERKQASLDKSQKRKIKRLESMGGARGSKGLLKIAFFNRTNHFNRGEAFSALVRLGRPEDVDEIIEQSQWYSRLDPIYMPYASKALGKMGGESACRALTFKFMTESEKLAYNSAMAKRLSFSELVNGIREGDCLAEDEILDRLRRFARDMWVSGGVMMPSLDLLAEAGDEKAQSLLWEIEHLPVTKDSSVDKYITVLKRTDLPIFIRRGYWGKFREAPGTKARVLGQYVDVVIAWVNEIPVSMLDNWKIWSHFRDVGGSILYSVDSTWDNFPESYFMDWARKVPDLVPSDVLEEMLKLLKTLDEKKVRAREYTESIIKVRERSATQ